MSNLAYCVPRIQRTYFCPHWGYVILMFDCTIFVQIALTLAVYNVLSWQMMVFLII